MQKQNRPGQHPPRSPPRILTSVLGCGRWGSAINELEPGRGFYENRLTHSLVGRGLVGLHRLDGLLLVLGFNGLLREFVLRHGGRLGAWENGENMA